MGRFRRRRGAVCVALQRPEQTLHQDPAQRLHRRRLHDQSQEPDLGGLPRTQPRGENPREDLRVEQGSIHGGEGADGT